MAEINTNHINIAVMGGIPAVRDSLVSHASDIGREEAHYDEYTGAATSDILDKSRIDFIDIPAIDGHGQDIDETVTPTQVLSELDGPGKKIAGVLFLHHAMDEFPDKKKELFEELRKTCGEKGTLVHLVLFGSFGNDEGFLPLPDSLSNGVRVLQYDGTRDSASEILSHVLLSQPRRGDHSLDQPEAETGTPLKLDDDAHDDSDAKSNLDSTDDNQDATTDITTPDTAVVDPVLTAAATASQKHLTTLASLHSQIEQAALSHSRELSIIFTAEITTLNHKLQASQSHLDHLTTLVHQKNSELTTLRTELALSNELHAQQQTQSAEAQAHLQSQLIEQQAQLQSQITTLSETKADLETQLVQAQEAQTRVTTEHTAALDSLRAELTRQSEQRAAKLMQDLGREAEERVSKVRAEMARMKAGYEQGARETRAEMARLVGERDREREKRVLAERERERMRMGGNSSSQTRRGGQGQHGGGNGSGDDEYRQGLQSWAIARLWGVGQARAR